jgi:GNAT superfamily N-acetyltransferase
LSAQNAQGEWSIRRAFMEDAPAIGRFHAACWVDAYRGIVPEEVLARIGPAEREVRWRRRLAECRRSTAIAELEEVEARIVGFVTWGPSHDEPEPDLPALELASLYVDHAQWGSGLAAALLEHAIGDAPAQLWVYFANARARAFYQKHGFAPDGHVQVDESTGVLECRYVRK